MSDYDNIGKLMYLPVKDIKPGEKFTTSDFILSGAVEAVLQAGGRNWLPLIVKEIAEYQYQAVSNYLVYEVAKKAGLQRVWCIVIDTKPETIEQVKILNGEAVPKINLNTASADTIKVALKYLKDKPGSELKTLDVTKATQKISSANRETWKTFSEITKLKCGITTAKADILKEVFFLEPPAKVEIPPLPEMVSIKGATRDEIFDRLNYLSTYKIDGFQGIDPDKTADIIFITSKTKWKSLNPITKLECGITTAQIKTLKTMFKL